MALRIPASILILVTVMRVSSSIHMAAAMPWMISRLSGRSRPLIGSTWPSVCRWSWLVEVGDSGISQLAVREWTVRANTPRRPTRASKQIHLQPWWRARLRRAAHAASSGSLWSRRYARTTRRTTRGHHRSTRCVARPRRHDSPATPSGRPRGNVLFERASGSRAPQLSCGPLDGEEQLRIVL